MLLVGVWRWAWPLGGQGAPTVQWALRGLSRSVAGCLHLSLPLDVSP